MAKFPYIIGKWAQGYIMHQQRMILNGLQYFSGLPNWVQNKASLSFNAEWAEYYNDYETNKLYFRDANFNRVAATFSRTSSATRVNKNGLIEVVATGIPRIDYTDGSAKLLMEPSRTNFETNTSRVILAGSITVAANQETSPDGTVNADKITKTDIQSYAQYYSNPNVNSGEAYSVSFFAKAGSWDKCALGFVLGDAGTAATAYYDLTNETTGAIGTFPAGVSSKIENYGNGWYRCSLSNVKTITDVNVRFVYHLSYSTTNTFWPTAADGNGEYMYFYGYQREAGSYPTSYIPTAGSAVTRNADVCETDENNFISTQSFTLFFKHKAIGSVAASSNYMYRLVINGGANIEFWVNSANGLNIFLGTNGGYIFGSSTNNGFNVGADSKVALSYDGDRLTYYINGSLYGSATGVSFVDAQNNISLRSSFTSFGQKNTIIFPTALTDSELAQLTS